MAQFFGYDDSSGRHWINLDLVSRATYFRDQQRAQVFVVETPNVQCIELRGDVAAKFAEAMGVAEATGSHVK